MCTKNENQELGSEKVFPKTEVSETKRQMFEVRDGRIRVDQTNNIFTCVVVG